MTKPTTTQLDAYLDRMMCRAQMLRTLNLDVESGIQQAIDESQTLLANLAMYRHLLKMLARRDYA